MPHGISCPSFLRRVRRNRKRRLAEDTASRRSWEDSPVQALAHSWPWPCHSRSAKTARPRPRGDPPASLQPAMAGCDAEHQPGPIGYAELYIEVTGARASNAFLEARVPIEWGPEVYSYGRREFAIRDPDRDLIISTEVIEEPPATSEPEMRWRSWMKRCPAGSGSCDDEPPPLKRALDRRRRSRQFPVSANARTRGGGEAVWAPPRTTGAAP